MGPATSGKQGLIYTLIAIPPSGLILLSVIFSVVFSEALVASMSLHFHGKVTRNYLITGLAAASVVSFVLSYILVSLIRHLRESKERYSALSLTDDLTGLYNRRGLYALGEHELKMANRLKRGMYILAADMDGLKIINDTLGHQEGDKAITLIADVLKESFRDVDVIARIGGDEFVMVPIGMTGDNIGIVLERLQKGLELQDAKTSGRYKLSLSVGTAYYDPDQPCSLDELLRRADKVMYEQKRTKKASKR